MYSIEPPSPMMRIPSWTYMSSSMQIHPSGGFSSYFLSWFPLTYSNGTLQSVTKKDRYSGGRSPHEIMRSMSLRAPDHSSHIEVLTYGRQAPVYEGCYSPVELRFSVKYRLSVLYHLSVFSSTLMP